MRWDEFFVTGDPMIYAADASIVLATIAIVAVLTYFKKWKWLWTEWLTTVDHKKIGVMYILAALLMMFRGGVDGLLMRVQLAAPEMKFLESEHYNQIFTTHGTLMILFMAMPFIFGMINIAMPLQIGARDVAFPWLNALSFWLFFAGAMLFNLSFVIGGSPDAGWTSYTPLASLEHSPGVGQNYYLWGLQLSGIGSLASGINFIVTILRLRAPGMTLAKMPMFTWSVLITSVIIVYAFPILTVALALLTLDRMFGTHFFTVDGGGMPMMWVNLFWMWGHPEVYIVILPAFGIFSEIVATFSRKRLFGHNAMVISMVAIAGLSFIVWAHHFYTMGAGPGVNSFFSVSTMLIAIPTGVKIFNWLATMYKGRIRFTVPMMWTLAFIPNFVIGGVTGVMLAAAPADYQYHNSYFLVSHFHYVLIGGVVFGMIAGMYYWWPKIFGFKLNERQGKHGFWWFMIGFNVTFFPQYILGLMGMPRRIYMYSNPDWGLLNLTSTVGTLMQGVGFLIICYNIYWSIRYAPRTNEADPWDARTLEWAIPSPAPYYNFSRIPEVKEIDPVWYAKKRGEKVIDGPLEKVHMPSNSGVPFILGQIFFVFGFGFVFGWYWMVIPAFIGVLLCMAWRSFDYDYGYYVSTDEIKKIEGV